MQQQIAAGFIPYEIGDTIVMKNSNIKYVIEDIRMIQYIKDKKVEFEVLIIGNWHPVSIIEKRIV